jgi:hypothetical protein
MQAAPVLMQSANAMERKGGLVILAVMAEGCKDLFLEALPQLMPVVCGGFSDANVSHFYSFLLLSSLPV